MSKTTNILAILILLGYACVEALILTHTLPADNLDIILRTQGTLDMMVGTVVGFYFGSSMSSRRKDETISKALGNEPDVLPPAKETPDEEASS